MYVDASGKNPLIVVGAACWANPVLCGMVVGAIADLLTPTELDQSPTDRSIQTIKIEKHLFGLVTSIESSQDFSLIPDLGELDLLHFLSEDIRLNKNPHFKEMKSVYSYLRKQRELLDSDS